MVRILFVCTGNTCRSPMAEAILRSRALGNVEVKSAGVYAANGSGASVHAKGVLEENQIWHDHRSSLLTKELVEWATYILSMTEGHKMAIAGQYPDAVGKTFTLKEFAGGYPGLDVFDPYGGPIEVYRETFAEINEAIDAVVARLKQ